MEEVSFIRVAVALVFVLALIGAMSWGLRRWQSSRGMGNAGGSMRRLMVVEQLYLDPKRRLVLVKCDETEHLLLLGAQHEHIVAGGDTLQQAVKKRDESK